MFETPLSKIDPELLQKYRDAGRLDTLIMGNRPFSFENLVAAIQEQGLGFALITVRDKIAPPGFVARVFQYEGVNAVNAQKAIGNTMEEALTRAFVAFHEQYLLYPEAT